MDGYMISWVINGYEYVMDYDKIIDGFCIIKTETDTGRTEYIKFDDGTYITDFIHGSAEAASDLRGGTA